MKLRYHESRDFCLADKARKIFLSCLPLFCGQGNFPARRGNKCYFLSSDEPSCHLPLAKSQFRHFPNPQTTATAAFGKIELAAASRRRSDTLPVIPPLWRPVTRLTPPVVAPPFPDVDGLA